MLIIRPLVLFNNSTVRCLSSVESYHKLSPVAVLNSNCGVIDKNDRTTLYRDIHARVSVNKTMQILARTRLCTHFEIPMQENPAIPSRLFHTNTNQYMSVPSPQIQTGSSPQGIQGDNCANFKLWMESCRRYGLENCDQQLQGIQTGRKTLSQVLQEQDDLITSIAERYQKETTAKREDNRNTNIQAAQEGGVSFPAVDSPCPQGIQGDDCVQFKLWLENCHRFGFSQCEEQFDTITSGRKNLQQVFREQDDLIRSVVNQFQQRRGYSTSTSASTQDGNNNLPLSQTDRLKKAVKDYGSTVIVFHIGISLISFGGFYLAVSSGLDVVGLLTKMGVGESIVQSKAVTGAGHVVLSYAIHKVFAPARIAITLTSTPFIVRYLRRIGFLKSAKPSSVK